MSDTVLTLSTILIEVGSFFRLEGFILESLEVKFSQRMKVTVLTGLSTRLIYIQS